MGRKHIVAVLFGMLLFFTAANGAVLASITQQAEDEEAAPAPDLRDRIAAFIEQFVADDETVTNDASPTDEAPTIEIDPNIVTGAIALLAVGVAALLIVRGYQAPGKRDPFRSRW